MKSIFLGFFIFLIACTTNPDELQSDLMIDEAVLSNQLPVDGCDWHFTLVRNNATVRYAASMSSEKLLQEAIKKATVQNGLGSLRVQVTYYLTNQKKSVTCGWNTKQEMDEIELKEIKPI